MKLHRMNVMNLMVVALADWINQEQNVIDYATAASGLADCFAITTGMRRETDDFNFWTLRCNPHRKEFSLNF